MIHLEKDDSSPLEILGFGIVRITHLNFESSVDILYQKGVGNQLIKQFFEIKQNQILQKKEGISIDIFCDFTVSLHYFNTKPGEIIAIIYFDKKEAILDFSRLYKLSKRLNKYICKQAHLLEIQQVCNDKIKIPQSNGIIALYIINSSRHFFFSER